VKVGDLVRFKSIDYSFYGIGLVRESLWSGTGPGWSILFGTEILQVREWALEILSEGR
jgi:hypothetical protein